MTTPDRAAGSVKVWPSVDNPSWTQLSLTDTGDELRVAVTYGLGLRLNQSGSEPTTITVVLDASAVRQLADLATVVRRVLDAGGDPPVDAYRRACGTVHAVDSLVSVHARQLRVDGPASLAATVFVHNNQIGNYSAHFRTRAWAEIADMIAEAAARRDRP